MGQPLGAVPRRPPVLEVEDLSFQAGGAPILRGVSFTLGAGELVVVMGASGSGKTTLLRCLNRLVEPAGGHVRLDGTDTREIPPVQLRRRIGMVPQLPFMFDGTLRDNLERASDYSGVGLDDGEYARLLGDVGLDERLDRDARTLSVGQQQRVAMARALVSRPPVLLCDEPYAAVIGGALEVVAKRSVEHERKLGDHPDPATLTGMAAAGMGIVFVTHDAEQAGRIADRRLRLAHGRLEAMEDGGRRQAGA
jgi:putative ABC transport system ATP-binding protein